MLKALFFIFGLFVASIIPTQLFGSKSTRIKDLTLKQEVDLILVNTARNIRRESHSEMLNQLFDKAILEIQYLRKTNARQKPSEEVYFDKVVMALNDPPKHCGQMTSRGSESLIELLNKICSK